MYNRRPVAATIDQRLCDAFSSCSLREGDSESQIQRREGRGMIRWSSIDCRIDTSGDDGAVAGAASHSVQQLPAALTPDQLSQSSHPIGRSHLLGLPAAACSLKICEDFGPRDPRFP